MAAYTVFLTHSTAPFHHLLTTLVPQVLNALLPPSTASFFSSSGNSNATLFKKTITTFLATNEHSLWLLSLFGHWFFVALFSYWIIARIPKEEAMLQREFKGTWTKFTSTTQYRLIPFIY